MSQSLHHAAVDVLVTPSNVRKTFVEAAIEGLSASIHETGLQQPLLVRKDGSKLVVIDGERRLRACRRIGLKEVPVIVIDDPLTIADVLTRQLACNLQREDLSVLERAEAIQNLMEQGSMTADQVARRLGQSPATVSRTLSVLKLPAPLLAHVSSGHIPADSAYALARIDDPALQTELAAEVMGSTLTRDGLMRKLKRVRRAQAAPDKGLARVTAALGGGRSITLAGKGLSWESLVESLEQLLSRARKAKSQGLSLATFVRTLRDQAAS